MARDEPDTTAKLIDDIEYMKWGESWLEPVHR